MSLVRTEYECDSCKSTYFDYDEEGHEYYHKCSNKGDRNGKPVVIDDPRNENICTCGQTDFPLSPGKELRTHRGSGVNHPLPDHVNNEKHWDLWPHGNGYSHILANGKGRTRIVR